MGLRLLRPAPRCEIFINSNSFAILESETGEGKVEMMQIDCEVTNTQLLSVMGDAIPANLRQSSPYNSTAVPSLSANSS